MWFLERFCSFPKEIDRKEELQNFYWLIINCLYSRAARSDTGGCRAWSPLLRTQVGRACKKPSCFEEHFSLIEIMWKNYFETLLFFPPLKLCWTKLVKTTSIFPSLKLPQTKYVGTTLIIRPLILHQNSTSN